jgi:hypothetical protein
VQHFDYRAEPDIFAELRMHDVALIEEDVAAFFCGHDPNPPTYGFIAQCANQV